MISDRAVMTNFVRFFQMRWDGSGDLLQRELRQASIRMKLPFRPQNYSLKITILKL
jgi:hypothetical protein